MAALPSSGRGLHSMSGQVLQHCSLLVVSFALDAPCCRYEMQDVLAIEAAWLTDLAPHMYKLVPVNPQMRS